MGLVPFGTTEIMFCGICNGSHSHVLGGDDCWYCERCDRAHYQYILDYYDTK